MSLEGASHAGVGLGGREGAVAGISSPGRQLITRRRTKNIPEHGAKHGANADAAPHAQENRTRRRVWCYVTVDSGYFLCTFSSTNTETRRQHTGTDRQSSRSCSFFLLASLLPPHRQARCSASDLLFLPPAWRGSKVTVPLHRKQRAGLSRARGQIPRGEKCSVTTRAAARSGRIQAPVWGRCSRCSCCSC